MSRNQLTVDALVVGGGPAGLAAATAMRVGGAGRVVVLEREDEAGGIPRLCTHTGFGLRDLRRVLSGPVYARRWVEQALTSGVDIRTRTMVTGWSAPGRALATGPDGLLEVGAGVVVLATGARERPRAARLVPGTRPSGIFTTGQLQQWVHRQHLPVGRSALIVGAEHVSYSAVLTLREAGVRPVALVTTLRQPQTFRLFDLATRAGLRVPVWTRTAVAGVYGRDRVERVLLRDYRSSEREVAVDTVVFTGDFIPDNELARLAGLSVDPGTRGPACADDGTTSAEGIVAAGNLVHPVETADVAARRALKVGSAAALWLRRSGVRPPPRPVVRVRVADPLQWVVPNMIETDREVDQPVLVRARAFLDRPRLDVTQGGRLLASHRLRRMIPNRSHHIPPGWQRLVRPGEDVLISVFCPVRQGSEGQDRSGAT
jgi:NADPH-dependent 2,4-dienoyl-CoA reductase/sulfur reductase-like enzyme